MINTSVVEAHRFGRVKRSGYNPREVDAVIARLADELLRTRVRVASLTKRLEAADASADAIRQTFAAAESTCEEILDSARSDAETLTETAKNEALEVSELAEALGSQVATSREHMLSEMYEEADRHRQEVERKTAERSASSEWAIAEAVSATDRSIAETQARSEVAKDEAHLLAIEIRERIWSMERASDDLTLAAITLADSVQQDAVVLDLTTIERLERIGLDAIPPSEIAALTPPVKSELLRNIAEPADSNATEDGVGISLRDRIKIARMSD